MEQKDKYLGLTLNAWWLVKSKHYDTKQNRTFYTLVNQANGQVLENVRKETIDGVILGKWQVSKLISTRMKKKNLNTQQGWW